MSILSGRRITATILILVSSFVSFSQHIQKLTQDAYALAEKKEYAKSLELSRQIYAISPENINALVLNAFNLINLGKVDEAGGYITIGLQVDATYFPIYLDAGYYFAAKGNMESAKQYLTEATKMYPEELALQDVLDEFRLVGQNVNQVSQFNDLANWFEKTKRAQTVQYPTITKTFVEFEKEIPNGSAGIVKRTHEVAGEFKNLQWHDMVINMYTSAAAFLAKQYPSDALQLCQAGYAYYIKNGSRDNTLMAGFLYNQLLAIYEMLGDDESLVRYVAEVDKLSSQTSLHVYDVNCYIAAAGAYNRLQKTDLARRYAGVAYTLAEKSQFMQGLTGAANALCATYLLRPAQEDKQNAGYYGEIAYELARKYKLEDLMSAIVQHLALAYRSLGTEEGFKKCINTYGSLVAYHQQKQDFASASLALNNAGALFAGVGNFADAARLFEESIMMADRHNANLSNQDKLTVYQSQISAYQFLIWCYAELKNTEKTFEAMERSRSRVLAERIAGGKQPEKATIADLQAMLQPDEAAIMYSLSSGHEIAILVVTKKYSQILFNADNNFVGDIKDKYLDRMNKEHGARKGISSGERYDPNMRVVKEDLIKVTQLARKFFENPGMADPVLDEYLRGYYRFLILPVANRLTGVKKLLISSDDVLNFVPFEALKMGDGKYLVEKFDVKYFHSTAILKELQARNYSASRKPLLAMGGAVFHDMNSRGVTIETQQDLNLLQLDVQENLKKGKSQRMAYASLFGSQAMPYLQGTVDEVKNVASVVPGADVFLGDQMTENRIKALSQTQQLANYKVLHLATHGFVVNEIPDLSGVAMSIFPDEVDGEDGFLNTAEISNLNLKADLTVLSACQTALGKIYSGEGVTGLTQSLILAGSNAALVSLWPVNDNSTMLFMSGLYKETAKGKSYVQVMNELKRKFIKGEFGDQFRHPNYWAPFVYIGK